MKRQDAIRFYPQFTLLLSRLKIVYLGLITMVIVLYLLSVYFLLREQMVVSIGLASMAVLSYHFMQTMVFRWVKGWMRRDSENTEMLLFLEEELKRKQVGGQELNKLKDYFFFLEKVMEMVGDKQR